MKGRDKKFCVVGLGEVLWDVFPAGHRLGGAPANFAYHAAALGADAAIASSVGPDELGQEIFAQLARWDWILQRSASMKIIPQEP